MSTDQAVSAAREASGGAAGDLVAFFDQAWSRIITTQPAAVRAGLAAERALADDLLTRSAYRTLVEVGCADGSLLLPIALHHRLAYVGLDLAAGAVAASRAALAGAPGIVLRADVCDLPALELPLAPPALVAFPFNVFGNLAEPRRALAATAMVGADVLVLTYDTGQRATSIRAEYYRECGLAGTMSADEWGVHFTAGPFTSSVYHPPVLTGWLAELGYQPTLHRYGAAGLAYHGIRSGAPAIVSGAPAIA